MKKFRLNVLALFVVTASALTLHNGRATQTAATAPELMTNAAYRDGMYLGKLAAEQGTQPHVAVGRWAHADERAYFGAGYQQSYGETLALRAARNTPTTK